MEETPYIEPNFRITNSYEKLQELYQDEFSYLSRRDNDTSRITLGQILEHKLVFIVAEPGQGKSRLITELYSQSQLKTNEVHQCDLKTKTSDYSIEQWLRLKGVSQTASTVFLDGLDEAPAATITSTIYGLVDYIKTHPKTSFYISSRIHYFSKYQHNFSELSSAEFLLIKPLENSKAKAFLARLDIQKNVIEKLFSSLQFGESVSVLQNPRYLEMIANEIKKQAFDSDNLNRATLFEAFISHSLTKEDQKIPGQIAEYKKRLLELLALTMQVAQVKEITADDFVTFMDRVRSDAKMIVAQVDIENIYEHSLLSKDIFGTITFTNSEVQEYLAAKCLMRMANPERKVFMVAVEPGLREILPSWYNTLSFAIDELPRIARGIIDLNPNRLLLEESIEQLVTGCTSGKMSNEDRQYIFDYVWSSNAARHHVIGRNILFNLAGYASKERADEFANRLKYSKLSPKHGGNNLLNLTRLSGELIVLDRLDTVMRQKTIKKLIKLALESADYVVKAAALDALASAGDAGVLPLVVPLANTENSHVFSALESLAYNLEPNSVTAIDIYIGGLKRSNFYIARRGLEEIDTVEAIGYFLNRLASNAELIKAIIDHDRLFTDEQSQFLYNVNQHWQSEWLLLLKEFVLSAIKIGNGYYAGRARLIDMVTELIAGKDLNYYTELLSKSLEDGEGALLVRTDDILAKIMQPKDIVTAINAYRRMGDKGFLVFRIFEYVLSSDSPDKQLFREALEVQLPDQLKEYDKKIRKWKRQGKATSLAVQFQKVYAEIDDKITLGNYEPLGRAMDMVINHIEDTKSKETLGYTHDQIEHIWQLLKDRILDYFDIEQINVTINQRHDGRASFNISSLAQWYERAIIFGYLTKSQSLDSYKNKLLRLFPFMIGQEKKDIFLSLNLTKADKLKIAEAYRDTASAKAQFQPHDFVELVEDWQLAEAVDILRSLVLTPHIQLYVKEKALRIAESLDPSKEYIRELRGRLRHGEADDSKALLLTIDELLIVNYGDQESIGRRFALLEKRASAISSSVVGGMRYVSGGEEELYDKKYAKPLMKLRDRKYLDDFLDLLNFSFTVSRRGEDWYRYAAYLWDVTNAYFQNLSVTKEIKILQMIRGVIEKHPAEATTYYIPRLNALTRDYLEQISDKKPYISAINMVNTINVADELDITSEEELLYEVKELITELERWVRQEGSRLTRGNEVNAQINIAIRFENILLKKFNRTDIIPRIERESQSVDGTRTDFYVYFGFIGPILIELKLSKHKDLTGDLSKKPSYASMEKYMKQFGAKYGVLLIFKTELCEEGSFNKILLETKQAYEQIAGVSVMGIHDS